MAVRLKITPQIAFGLIASVAQSVGTDNRKYLVVLEGELKSIPDAPNPEQQKEALVALKKVSQLVVTALKEKTIEPKAAADFTKAVDTNWENLSFKDSVQRVFLFFLGLFNWESYNAREQGVLSEVNSTIGSILNKKAEKENENIQEDTETLIRQALARDSFEGIEEDPDANKRKANEINSLARNLHHSTSRPTYNF